MADQRLCDLIRLESGVGGLNVAVVRDRTVEVPCGAGTEARSECLRAHAHTSVYLYDGSEGLRIIRAMVDRESVYLPADLLIPTSDIKALDGAQREGSL